MDQRTPLYLEANAVINYMEDLMYLDGDAIFVLLIWSNELILPTHTWVGIKITHYY